MNIRKLLELLVKPGERLSERVVFAGFWAFALQIMSRGLSFIRIIILARLLAPDDFGLIGIVLLMMGILESFTQFGFTQALIQRKGDIQSYLNTAWTVGIVRGLALGGILFASAPLIASFFDAPAVRAMVQVIAAALILKGLENPGMLYLTKELQFRRLLVYQIAVTIAELGTAIAAAIILQNAWALVYEPV